MTGSVDKTITKSFFIAFCLNCGGRKIPKKNSILLQTKSQLKRELHLCIGVHKTAFVCSRLLHLCALDFCIRAQPTFIFAMPVSPWKWMSRKYCSVLMLFHCIPNSLLDHGLIFESKCRKSISFCTEPFDHWTNYLELQQGLEPQEFDFTNPDDDDHTCFLWRFSRLHFSILSWNIRLDVIDDKGVLGDMHYLGYPLHPFRGTLLHCSLGTLWHWVRGTWNIINSEKRGW